MESSPWGLPVHSIHLAWHRTEMESKDNIGGRETSEWVTFTEYLALTLGI
jgi:hypothetical protein